MAQPLVVELMQQYRARLEAAASQCPEAERSLYALHRKALGELEEALTQGARPEILRILATERRAFGWSFLSGNGGDATESAFSRLASELERT